jgi:hypothetical protein
MLDRQKNYRNKNYDRIPNTNQQYTKNVKIERGKITIDLN